MPRHSGNAASAECAEPATTSISPAASARYAASTGKSSSTAASWIPSSCRQPSSAAATAGKYEFDTRSGTAIFMVDQRAPPEAGYPGPKQDYPGKHEHAHARGGRDRPARHALGE